jgi:hypothetical protein
LDSALRASLRLSKIAPGDFVAALTPTYLGILRWVPIKKIPLTLTLSRGGERVIKKSLRFRGNWSD